LSFYIQRRFSGAKGINQNTEYRRQNTAETIESSFSGTFSWHNQYAVLQIQGFAAAFYYSLNVIVRYYSRTTGPCQTHSPRVPGAPLSGYTKDPSIYKGVSQRPNVDVEFGIFSLFLKKKFKNGVFDRINRIYGDIF